jgi:predicted enzyme related to lactoylglutathione lyase
MRINAIRIPSLDMNRSELFYSRLFDCDKAFGDTNQGFLGFVLENVNVLLEPAETGEFEAGGYLGFSLEVPDIMAFYENLRDEVAFSHPPEKQTWGGIMTHVTDSSGNVLSIVEVNSDV